MQVLLNSVASKIHELEAFLTTKFFGTGLTGCDNIKSGNLTSFLMHWGSQKLIKIIGGKVMVHLGLAIAAGIFVYYGITYALKLYRQFQCKDGKMNKYMYDNATVEQLLSFAKKQAEEGQDQQSVTVEKPKENWNYYSSFRKGAKMAAKGLIYLASGGGGDVATCVAASLAFGQTVGTISSIASLTPTFGSAAVGAGLYYRDIDRKSKL